MTDIRLSDDQQKAVDLIKEGHHILITGPGGTGKSFLVDHIRKQLPNTALTATTGIAAVNIGGRTYHSWSGMGLGKETVDELVEKVLKSRWCEAQRATIKRTKHLIIDEISMMGADHFVKLDQICRAIRQSDEPFGGIQLIMFGDFLQLPPVKDEYVFTSPLWDYLLPAVIVLTTIHRQKDKEFAELLHRVREAKHTKEDMVFLEGCGSKKLEQNLDDQLILHSHNDAVDQFNKKMLNDICADEFVFHANDSGKGAPLKALQRDCISPAELVLKSGARVMLTKNLGNGLCNGSLGTVVRLDKLQVWVQWDRLASVMKMNHETWEVTDTVSRDVLARRSQFPLRLAWAITIHKSQGMSLRSANIYLGKCFAPGQAYVALSRMESAEGMRLSSFKPTCIKADPLARAFYNKHAITT